MGIFRFKEFSINDDGSTMKVGTDAVLLGAWCPVGLSRRILDIGTGSGVIALMLAQRSHEESTIDAVELSERDADQALDNVKQSPWPRKVNVIRESIQNFKSDKPYDLIVCNPPFFSNSLLPPDPRRSEARHDTRLTADELISAVSRLLALNGTFSLILPAGDSEGFQEKSSKAGLHLVKRTLFHTRPDNPPERALMSFSQTLSRDANEEQLVLYRSGDQKSSAYQELTRDFYL